jgi:hypothetical protein
MFEECVAQRKHGEPPEGEARQSTSNSALLEKKSADEHGQQQSDDTAQQERQSTPNLALAWQPAAAFGSVAGSSTSPAAAAPPISWEQLSAYVDRLLMNAQPANASGPAAIVTLADGILPGTTLSLLRAPEGGWVLQVAAPSTQVFQQLQSHAASLQQRFWWRKLGDLRIEAQVDPVI